MLGKVNKKCQQEQIYGIENEDLTITYVYHHFDGYLEGLGTELFTDFKIRKEVNSLISQGDMSCIGKPYTARGEELNISETENRDSYKEEFEDSWCEFAYLFNKDSEWEFISNKNLTWNKLLDFV